jgi:hypothetical protein
MLCLLPILEGLGRVRMKHSGWSLCLAGLAAITAQRVLAALPLARGHEQQAMTAGTSTPSTTPVQQCQTPDRTAAHACAMYSRVVLKIARWYKVSASDVLAVCAAVATETLGGPQVFGPNNPLP